MKIKTAMLLLRLEFKRKAGKDMLNMWCWTLDHSWQALPRLIFCLQTSQVPRHVVLFWTPLNSPSRQLRLLQRAAAVSLNGLKCCHCRLPYCLTFCFLPLFHICPARSRLRGFRWTLIFKELKERMRFEVVSRVLKFFFLIPRFKDLNELHTTHFSLKRNDTIMNNLAPITKRAGGAERRKCHVLHTVTVFTQGGQLRIESWSHVSLVITCLCRSFYMKHTQMLPNCLLKSKEWHPKAWLYGDQNMTKVKMGSLKVQKHAHSIWPLKLCTKPCRQCFMLWKWSWQQPQCSDVFIG